jgi:hypothetical protein
MNNPKNKINTMKNKKQTVVSPLRRSVPALLALALCGGLASAYADVAVDNNPGVVSPIQATVDPLGLPIVNPVMLAGSDATAASFDQNVLPAALGFIQSNLEPDGQNHEGNPLVFQVDPSKLALANTTDLRAYFVSQSSGDSSTIGFNTTGTGVNSGNPELIFPSATSTENINPNPADNYAPRNPWQPLLPGDFVNLGTYAAGTALNFFMIANGANGGATTFNSGGAAANPDGYQHAAAFTPSVFAIPQLNSPYLFLTFKDSWNLGDGDFNDVTIAINVGAATIHSLMATPEPSMYLTLGGFLALAIWAKRRMDRSQTVAQA